MFNADDHKDYKNLASSQFSEQIWSKIDDLLAKIGKEVADSKQEHFALGVIKIINFSDLMQSFERKDILKALDFFLNFLHQEFEIKDLSITGMENIVFCVPIQSREKWLHKLRKLMRKIKVLTYPDSLEFFFVINLGYSTLCKNGNVRDAFQKAYLSLFESLRTGIGFNYKVFEESMDSSTKYKNDAQLATYFRKCITEKRLRLSYQPIMCSKTGEVNVYECLLRIITEGGHLISAGPFIPIAEKIGFIDLIDLQVLELVTAEVAKYKDVEFAINVSNQSIDNQEWMELARKVITPDIASRLTIEVTETGSESCLKKLVSFVEKLQGLGCKIAIDDFGSGNTSFLQLKEVSADVVKIDGSFVKDMHINPNNRLFVQLLIDLANKLGVKTVAEFVENGEIAKQLIDMGVSFLQGNYLSPALNYRPWHKSNHRVDEELLDFPLSN